MIIEDLFNIVSKLINNTTDIESILITEEVKQIQSSEIIGMSDQEISEFIKEKEKDEQKQKLIFDTIQKIKIEKSIDSITDDVEIEKIEDNKKIIYSLFSRIVEPDNVQIKDDELHLTYSFKDGSKLKNKAMDIGKWNRDNVTDTISQQTGVPVENIAIIDSVSSYIEFIDTFEDSNYVSRGQKDCTYKLEPSLHRIYTDGYIGHSFQYESAFRQRVLYYDDTTEKKNDEELRAYGQHYGLPTNYLDFTEAHLISLLFAVEDYEYIDNHSIIFFVDALSYNKETIKTERKLMDFSDDDLKSTLQKTYADKSYFIRVGNCNERIHFQKGCFLKVEANDDLVNMFSKYTKVAIIDKEFKEDILKELFKLGITFENIYPDKDNMVKTIRFLKEHM